MEKKVLNELNTQKWKKKRLYIIIKHWYFCIQIRMLNKSHSFYKDFTWIDSDLFFPLRKKMHFSSQWRIFATSHVEMTNIVWKKKPKICSINLMLLAVSIDIVQWCSWAIIGFSIFKSKVNELAVLVSC